MTTGVLYHKAMAGCVFFPEHCIHGAGRSHCDRFGVPSSPKNCRNKPSFDIVRWFQTFFSKFSPPHLLGRWVTTLMCLPSLFRFIRWTTILVEISWYDFKAPGRLAGRFWCTGENFRDWWRYNHWSWYVLVTEPPYLKDVIAKDFLF